VSPLVPAIDTNASFATPEHIAFTFRVAGPMIRFFAWIVDFILRLLVMGFLAIPLVLLDFNVGVGLWLLAFFVIDWLLGAVIEWRWEGFTPGKRLCHIRVIGIDGLPAGAGACFLRNILRFADSMPSFATGIVAMVISGRFQRLGDLAAGTLVVYDESVGGSRLITLSDKRLTEVVDNLPAEIQSLVDGNALRVIVNYVAHRERFHVSRKQEMAKPLAEVLARQLDLPDPKDPDLFLCAVYQKLAAPLTATKSTAAGTPITNTSVQATSRAASYLARRQRAWADVENILSDSSKSEGKNTRRGSLPDAVRFSTLYRAACADLALADAYHLPANTVSYLHRLVARAHLRFYRRLAIDWRKVAQQLLIEVPGRLYGDGCLRIALLSFYGTFLLSAIFGAFAPEQAVNYFGQGMADDLREMYAEPPNRRAVDQGALMYGFYISNNVGITLSCFASGIFAGIGSLLWLAANGVFLGFCFGYMSTVDVATSDHFFEFVTAHGPFELTGIALGGAAGLRLGLGLIRTRGLPRLESLMASARESVPIIAVAAILVATAAPIEAFISPSSLPWWGKLSISIFCLLLIVTYLVGFGYFAQKRLRNLVGEP
jgi:uncharacterized membrane protein SpoIIM required for sporulation/uncharacterized RDD family membrane protein YckC